VIVILVGIFDASPMSGRKAIGIIAAETGCPELLFQPPAILAMMSGNIWLFGRRIIYFSLISNKTNKG